MPCLTLPRCCLTLFKCNKDESLPRSRIPSPYAAATIDSPRCSRAFNDTRKWRRLIFKAIKPNYDEEAIRTIQRIPGTNMCVKYGLAVQLQEAAALRLVAEKTSIPVPKVHSAFRHDQVTYIVMDFVEGEQIGHGWAGRSEEEKQSLLQEVKQIFEELHNIPHPRPSVLAAVDMQALYDARLWKGGLAFGPYATESDFHNFLRCGVQADDDMIKKETCTWVTDEEKAEMLELVTMHESKQHKICFIHGDASSTNIIVKDGKVAALIDFELSGFYPEYWEYTTAMNVNRDDGFWKEEVPKFLKEFPYEQRMEELRRKHFGLGGFRDRYPWDTLGCV